MATPGYFCVVGERVGRTVGAALVEPQAEVLGIRSGGLVEAGLVGQAEIVPAVAAAVLQLGVGGDGLQQVEGAEGVVGEAIPEPVVAAGPDQPHVAALDLVRGQRRGRCPSPGNSPRRRRERMPRRGRPAAPRRARPVRPEQQCRAQTRRTRSWLARRPRTRGRLLAMLGPRKGLQSGASATGAAVAGLTCWNDIPIARVATMANVTLATTCLLSSVERRPSCTTRISRGRVWNHTARPPRDRCTVAPDQAVRTWRTKSGRESIDMPPNPPTTTVTGPPSAALPGVDLVMAALRAIDISQVLVALRQYRLAAGRRPASRRGHRRPAGGRGRVGQCACRQRLPAGRAHSAGARLSVDWWYDIWVWDDSGEPGAGLAQLRDRHRQCRGAVAARHRPRDPASDRHRRQPERRADPEPGPGRGRLSRPADRRHQAAGLGLRPQRPPAGCGDRGERRRARRNRPQPCHRRVRAARPDPAAGGGGRATSACPSAQVPNVVSQGAVNIDNAQATRRGVSLDLGVLGFTFWVAPVVDIHIGTLTLSNVSLSAGIDRLRVEDVSRAGDRARRDRRRPAPGTAHREPDLHLSRDPIPRRTGWPRSPRAAVTRT